MDWEIGIGIYTLCVCKPLSRVRLCDSMDRSPPGSSVRGILQARILEWAAIPFYVSNRSLWELTVEHRELYSVLCDGLKGKKIPKGEDICKCAADSLRCMVGTNTTLQINYTPTKRSMPIFSISNERNHQTTEDQSIQWLACILQEWNAKKRLRNCFRLKKVEEKWPLNAQCDLNWCLYWGKRL